jgi:hypothetical protein
VDWIAGCAGLSVQGGLRIVTCVAAFGDIFQCFKRHGMPGTADTKTICTVEFAS